MQRHLQFLDAPDILIVTNCQYVHTVKEQLSQIDSALTKNILVEPEKKNTASAHPQRILKFEVGDHDHLLLGALFLFDRNVEGKTPEVEGLVHNFFPREPLP